MGQEIHLRKNEKGEIKLRLYSESSDCYISEPMSKEEFCLAYALRSLEKFLDDLLPIELRTQVFISKEEIKIEQKPFDIINQSQDVWINEWKERQKSSLLNPWKKELNPSYHDPLSDVQQKNISTQKRLTKELLRYLLEKWDEMESNGN